MRVLSPMSFSKSNSLKSRGGCQESISKTNGCFTEQRERSRKGQSFLSLSHSPLPVFGSAEPSSFSFENPLLTLEAVVTSVIKLANKNNVDITDYMPKLDPLINVFEDDSDDKKQRLIDLLTLTNSHNKVLIEDLFSYLGSSLDKKGVSRETLKPLASQMYALLSQEEIRKELKGSGSMGRIKLSDGDPPYTFDGEEQLFQNCSNSMLSFWKQFHAWCSEDAIKAKVKNFKTNDSDAYQEKYNKAEAIDNIFTDNLNEVLGRHDIKSILEDDSLEDEVKNYINTHVKPTDSSGASPITVMSSAFTTTKSNGQPLDVNDMNQIRLSFIFEIKPRLLGIFPATSIVKEGLSRLTPPTSEKSGPSVPSSPLSTTLSAPPFPSAINDNADAQSAIDEAEVARARAEAARAEAEAARARAEARAEAARVAAQDAIARAAAAETARDDAQARADVAIEAEMNQRIKLFQQKRDLTVKKSALETLRIFVLGQKETKRAEAAAKAAAERALQQAAAFKEINDKLEDLENCLRDLKLSWQTQSNDKWYSDFRTACDLFNPRNTETVQRNITEKIRRELISTEKQAEFQKRLTKVKYDFDQFKCEVAICQDREKQQTDDISSFSFEALKDRFAKSNFGLLDFSVISVILNTHLGFDVRTVMTNGKMSVAKMLQSVHDIYTTNRENGKTSKVAWEEAHKLSSYLCKYLLSQPNSPNNEYNLMLMLNQNAFLAEKYVPSKVDFNEDFKTLTTVMFVSGQVPELDDLNAHLHTTEHLEPITQTFERAKDVFKNHKGKMFYMDQLDWAKFILNPSEAVIDPLIKPTGDGKSEFEAMLRSFFSEFNFRTFSPFQKQNETYVFAGKDGLVEDICQTLFEGENDVGKIVFDEHRLLYKVTAEQKNVIRDKLKYTLTMQGLLFDEEYINNEFAKCANVLPELTHLSLKLLKQFKPDSQVKSVTYLSATKNYTLALCELYSYQQPLLDGLRKFLPEEYSFKINNLECNIKDIHLDATPRNHALVDAKMQKIWCALNSYTDGDGIKHIGLYDVLKDPSIWKDFVKDSSAYNALIQVKQNVDAYVEGLVKMNYRFKFEELSLYYNTAELQSRDSNKTRLFVNFKEDINSIIRSADNDRFKLVVDIKDSKKYKVYLSGQLLFESTDKEEVNTFLEDKIGIVNRDKLDIYYMGEESSIGEDFGAFTKQGDDQVELFAYFPDEGVCQIDTLLQILGRLRENKNPNQAPDIKVTMLHKQTEKPIHVKTKIDYLHQDRLFDRDYLDNIQGYKNQLIENLRKKIVTYFEGNSGDQNQEIKQLMTQLNEYLKNKETNDVKLREAYFNIDSGSKRQDAFITLANDLKEGTIEGLESAEQHIFTWLSIEEQETKEVNLSGRLEQFRDNLIDAFKSAKDNRFGSKEVKKQNAIETWFYAEQTKYSEQTKSFRKEEEVTAISPDPDGYWDSGEEAIFKLMCQLEDIKKSSNELPDHSKIIARRAEKEHLDIESKSIEETLAFLNSYKGEQERLLQKKLKINVCTSNLKNQASLTKISQDLEALEIKFNKIKKTCSLTIHEQALSDDHLINSLKRKCQTRQQEISQLKATFVQSIASTTASSAPSSSPVQSKKLGSTEKTQLNQFREKVFGVPKRLGQQNVFSAFVKGQIKTLDRAFIGREAETLIQFAQAAFIALPSAFELIKDKMPSIIGDIKGTKESLEKFVERERFEVSRLRGHQAYVSSRPALVSKEAWG